MRILFVVSGRITPSTRYRILQYLESLRNAGHRCDVFYSFPSKYEYFPWLGWRLSQRLKRCVRRWHAWLAKRRQYDSIVIEREVFDDDTFDVEILFRQSTGWLVLDVDDGVFLRHPEKFAAITPICDIVIAGNEYLEQYLRQYNENSVVIPTCIRMSDYPSRPPASNKKMPTIGWVGTTHNVAFLSVAAAALRRVAVRHPFRLLVVSGTAERLPEVDLAGVDVEFRKWSADREVADLHEMDIGLMPLPNDQDWMKFKCGFKLLQYLAVGVPGVASPIGVNNDILLGDRVGRRADSDQQWEEALMELLEDSGLRAQLGDAGRRLVEERYSIESNWMRLEQALTPK